MIRGYRFQHFRFAPRCLLFLGSFFLLPFSLAKAALDPETDKPYRLQVVLRMAENRLLTPVFKDLVEQQLGDSLRAALGDLAKVEIVREHALLKVGGAKELKSVLDAYSVLSNTKIHFVLIDFVNGRYEIHARQYDGFTGLASVMRHSSTADRQLVARSAALLIDQDFGLAGTVDIDRIQRDRVDVKLKGGALKEPLGHWLRKDQVFAVTKIIQGSPQQLRSFRIPWTLLQVVEEPHGEVCHCRLLSRWKDPLSGGPGVLGYRCIKLGTAVAPLRLRLVKDELGTPATAVQVMISRRGFDFGDELDKTSTRPDGLVESSHPYPNVAFVKISEGEQDLARVPVEIIEDQTLTCLVNVNAETAARGELLHRRQQWVRRVYEGLEVAANLYKELGAMNGQSRENALARAQQGLKAMQSNISNLAAEPDSLRAEAATGLPNASPIDLTEGEQGLQELQSRRDKLQLFIGELQAVITEEKNPNRQKWKELVAQARLQEEEAEFEKAIRLYEQVRAEAGNSPELRSRLDDLNRAWKVKNKEHEKARTFIYETWPKLATAAQINAKLEEARKAFLTCKEVGDNLSPYKLLKAYVTHTDRLAKEGDALNPEAKEDDRKTAVLIIKLTQELKEFNEQVKEYLRKSQPQGK